jgi:pimeloyl-ACP methyl ester carboxylesterase
MIVAPAAAAGAAAGFTAVGCGGRQGDGPARGTVEPGGGRAPLSAAPGPATTPADTSGPATVWRTTFLSAARRRAVSMVVVFPPGHGPPVRASPDGDQAGRAAASGSPPPGGGGGPGVCVVLHGRGDDAERSITLMGLDEHLGAAVRSGVPPFAVAAVDGGETYWHRRASGDDPERMILDEVAPRLAGLGLRTSRLALMGWSMGGYGALLMARRRPGLVVAVAASSPAMWRSFGASAPGAFDSASDFATHRVLGTPPALGVAYRVDCGDADPFSAVSRQAARELRAQEYSFGAGGHTAGYWRGVAPAQLAFVGHALHRAA